MKHEFPSVKGQPGMIGLLATLTWNVHTDIKLGDPNKGDPIYPVLFYIKEK